MGAPVADRSVWVVDHFEDQPFGAAYIYSGLNLIFADGFESGGLSAWDSSVP